MSLPGLVDRPSVSDTWPGPHAHASTLAETRDGLVLAFFGGAREEGVADLNVYVSRWDGRRWSRFTRAGDGTQSDGTRQPVWNPVLFQPPDGPLHLFYKEGPSPSTWWGVLRTSDDQGRTWGPRRLLADGLIGPAKNKPLVLASGDWLAPTSTERPDVGWRVYFERSADRGRTWRRSDYVAPQEVEAIQPTLLVEGASRLRALVRTGCGRIFETTSGDAGETWSPLRATALPNPNSGIDAVTLRDGRHLLVYNPTSTPRVRAPLSLALSTDGVAWRDAGILDDVPGGRPPVWPEQLSYPAVIQAADGLVHVTWSWHRRAIHHAILDPARLETR